MEPNTILVAVGEEDAGRTDAMARAVRKIAGSSDGRVVLTHVIPSSEYEGAVAAVAAGSEAPRSVTLISGAGRSPSGGEAADRELSESEVFETVVNQRSVVRDLADRLDEAGVGHEIRGGVGDPADLVVDLADDLDADFVVVGGRDRSPAKQALFGSVSQEIIRSVAAPVVVVRGRAEG